MTENKKVLFAYTVVALPDGTLQTHPAPVDEEVERQASRYDMFVSSKELVQNIETQLLADRIANIVVAKLTPADESGELKSKLLNALNERGITPSQE